ncbi:MAG TPA: hypothetical protein VFP20_09990 [Bacteroidales bacterium]|nr:hypothetical protein [Bacteroidales bacterium]
MKKQFDWKGLLYTVGILAFFLGVLDPLEGSIIILIGSVLMTLYKYLRGDRHKRGFLAGCLLIAVGVGYMFYMSSLGGFGPEAMPWVWGIPMVLYPIGWFLTAVLLYLHAQMKWKLRKHIH